MSVPHLDWRTIYGRDCIFFGPFAGFKPTVFNQKGAVASTMDWFATLKPNNIMPLIKTGLYNLDLVKYLLKEVMASKDQQLATLRGFYPEAKAEDWTMIWAGQRITTVAPNGALEFGTKVMASKDKTIVGLLGASPGASVSPHIAIECLDHFNAASEFEQQWHMALAQMIPSYGRDLNAEPGLYDKTWAHCSDVLLHGELSGFKTAQQNMEKVFKRLDVDSDGNLSVQELRLHLQKNGVAAESIDAVINQIDADQSGDITRDEFKSGFSDFITGQLTRGAPAK